MDDDLLKAFYEYYWLRPENGIWRARDASFINKFKFKGKILDFGSGDGAISFLMAGGRFHQSYDAFSEVVDTSKFYDGIDIYDSEKNREENIILKNANYKVDIGFDLKEGLIKKSEKLNFYQKLVKGDGNFDLPFNDCEFDTIFSNIFYWLNDPYFTIRELKRILSSNGELILLLPDENLSNYSLYNNFYVKEGMPKSRDYLKKIDMGRLGNNIKIAKSESEWNDLFSWAGLRVVDHFSYISGSLVRAWDVGLRPISPYLIEMSNAIEKTHRMELKKRWINETFDIFKGFYQEQEGLEKTEPPAFHIYALSN